ncbi:NAD(P)-dependent oxidoreductase [Brenneria goodwinii]|uniref:D-3-phosphoglycerate dehydrogenase n=1 Tax=Brenneria goodwinii TaxID=1109412 RepID=A0A0G4JVM6_9GAMM|nr:NAD(P)-dependent oxidoreductase [Brenneria goodwinii]CPR16622.1 D-3-phosphoglycerate dehydrogenase [Brenneria goodwinii]
MLIALSGQYSPILQTRLSEKFSTIDISTALDTRYSSEISLLVTRGALHIDRNFLQKLPNLKKIIKAGSGLDTIDLSAAKKRGIEVVATGGSTESVAELALALLFSCLRNIPILNDAVRRGDWGLKNDYIASSLDSRRIGIIGFGRIGQAFSIMVRSLNAPVFAWDHSIQKESKINIMSKFNISPCTSLIELLQKCNVISVHLPLGKTTRSLIGLKEFSSMQHGTILINTARAAIVEKDALINALSNGTLDSAGLDVHYNEGGEAENESLFSLKNVVLTPHVGAQSYQSQQAIAERILSEVTKFASIYPYPCNKKS